uniref:Uncharacterized protein n=1 Tax=Arundo donax TaxID=35708 RepID=A0A0A9FXI4_ARUDO
MVKAGFKICNNTKKGPESMESIQCSSA